MLHLYSKEDVVKGNIKLPVVKDVEEAFVSISLKDDAITRTILYAIDEAKYYDEGRVIDRFGTVIYSSQLSTGCKAALCVHYLQDRVIDLVECGWNARDAVVTYCVDGNAVFYYRSLDYSKYINDETKICVEYHGKVFTNVEEFNDCLAEEEIACLHSELKDH